MSDELTYPERCVYDQAVKGLSRKEIASNLYISKLTVDKHLYNIYKKCGIKSISNLLLYHHHIRKNVTYGTIPETKHKSGLLPVGKEN